MFVPLKKKKETNKQADLAPMLFIGTYLGRAMAKPDLKG